MYTGVPGSGKSCRLSSDILRMLSKGTYVLANFDYDASPYEDHFIRIPDYPKMANVYKIIKELPRNKREGNCCVCLDEVQRIFDSRAWNAKGNDRAAWIRFMTLSRHMGANVILVAQSSGMVDKQIRACVQTEVKHMKVAAMGAIPFVLSGFGMLPLTFWVESYFGTRVKVASGFFLPRAKYWSRYDSFDLSFMDDAAVFE